MALRHGELASGRVTVVAVGGGPEAESHAARRRWPAGRREPCASWPVIAPTRQRRSSPCGWPRVVAEASFVWCGDISVGPRFGERAGLPRRRARCPPGARRDRRRRSATATRSRWSDGSTADGARCCGRPSPCVVSVEGGVARLRRAGFVGHVARRGRIDRRGSSSTCRRCHDGAAPLVRPYRPRARALAAPTGDTLDRLRELTDAGGSPAHGERRRSSGPAGDARGRASCRPRARASGATVG